VRETDRSLRASKMVRAIRRIGLVSATLLTATPAIGICATPNSASPLVHTNEAIETPPAIYAKGPTQSGRTTELRFDNLRELQIFCQLNAGGPPPPRRGGERYTMACYSPALDVVVLPSRKAWPSQHEIDELRAHEWAHARGWRHQSTGAGTDWAMSLPLRTPQTAAAYQVAARKIADTGAALSALSRPALSAPHAGDRTAARAPAVGEVVALD